MFARSLHPPAGHARACAALLCLAAGALLIAGCARHSARDSTSAGAESMAGRVLGSEGSDAFTFSRDYLTALGRLPYPLALDNRWDYTIRTRFTLVTDGGPQPPQVNEFPWQVRINSSQVIGVHTYLMVEEYNPLVVGPSAAYPERQDASGLYELDLPGVAAPGNVASQAAPVPSANSAALRAYVHRTLAHSPKQAAFERAAAALGSRLEAIQRAGAFGPGLRQGGPDVGEISLLRYPLRVGARWIVRNSPRFGREVVARERVSVPAGTFIGWRLRGTSELFGPSDRVYFWYASPGLVRIAFHLESEATDELGNPIGTVSADQNQVLRRFSLVGRGGRTLTGDATLEQTTTE